MCVVDGLLLPFPDLMDLRVRMTHPTLSFHARGTYKKEDFHRKLLLKYRPQTVFHNLEGPLNCTEDVTLDKNKTEAYM